MIDDKLRHIGIIVDGNGRWAKEKGMSRSMGHKYGADNLEKIADYACEKGLKYLSIYAFSTDNFKRSEEEVNNLMDLVIEGFTKKYKRLVQKGIKVVFSGAREGLREDVLIAMDEMREKSKNNTKATLNICLNYGGQEEIIRAAEKYHDDLTSGKVKKGQTLREDFYKYLDNDLPPLDIVIRTGGEKRLSNFMLYQMTYAEIYFVDTYFPDFSFEMFDKIVDDFYKRDRRFGGINEKKNNG